MGFLDRFKSDQKSNIHRDWKILDSIDQLKQLIKASHNKPIAIFKHSTTCGISSMSKYQLENDWSFEEGDMDFYYLDLLSHRDVSNKVAELTGIVHQSPQVILLKNGKATYHTSHHGINVGGLKQAL